MDQLLKSLPAMLGIYVAGLVLFLVFRTYLMTKIKINKWVILAAGIIVLFMPNLILLPSSLSFINYIAQGLFIFLLLWYFEVTGLFKRQPTVNPKTDKNGKYKSDIKYDKKKTVVIRPKAKPNRVKNLKK